MNASWFRSLFSRQPLHWVGAALAFGAVAALGGGLVATTGVVNLSAVPPHPEGWAKLLHYGMRQSVAYHAKQAPPDEPLDSPAMIARGAAQYAMTCENCHGAPGLGQSPVALSMRPEPPLIVDASTRLSDKELFFIVQNGVRYTGMPAWPVQDRPDEVWAMVAFLKAAPKLDAEAYVRLARAPATDPPRLEAAKLEKNGAGKAATVAISPFIPSNAPRPYLPGDPQGPSPSPAAVSFPRVGFGSAAPVGDPMAACVSCHSSDGSGRHDSAFPNLTLQTPQYLYDALKAYATGQRQSGIMWPVAANLSDADMRALAVQLGTAAPVVSTDDPPTAATMAVRAQGAELAAAGDGTRGSNDGHDGPELAVAPKVERCSSCHTRGAYLGKVVPRIAGQHAPYLRMQLHAFRNGGRGDTASFDPMVVDSHALSDAEITAVSEFYAAHRPVVKTAKN